MKESLIRLRASSSKGHHSGCLVDGPTLIRIFGDAVAEILIRYDGNEGRLETLDAEFLGVVRAGEYIEVRAKLTQSQGTSRRFECTAHKVIELILPNGPSARALPEPELVAKATAVATVPRKMAISPSLNVVRNAG
ncbi:3-aminobutyryl-CoA ammonia lyase [Mesorhizobium sp. M1142]|uniref:3-aminobutyryl-CoA ammonia lyase n=1 Tax=Mesorhizobium sp. M1142 TaxID=2957060 RepID=UPI003338B686